jgi:hypothetical protein
MHTLADEIDAHVGRQDTVEGRGNAKRASNDRANIPSQPHQLGGLKIHKKAGEGPQIRSNVDQRGHTKGGTAAVTNKEQNLQGTR